MIRDRRVDDRYLRMTLVLLMGQIKMTHFVNQDSYEQFKICDFVTGGKGNLVRGSDSPAIGSNVGMAASCYGEVKKTSTCDVWDRFQDSKPKTR